MPQQSSFQPLKGKRAQVVAGYTAQLLHAVLLCVLCEKFAVVWFVRLTAQFFVARNVFVRFLDERVSAARDGQVQEDLTCRVLFHCCFRCYDD